MQIKYGKRGRPSKKMQAAKAAAEKIFDYYHSEQGRGEIFKSLFEANFLYAHWDGALPDRLEGDGAEDKIQ